MRVSVVERLPLRFSEPFGVGADRHVHVRAASSIVRFAGGFLLAQDDSNFAAVWRPDGISALRLFPNSEGDTFGSTRGNKRYKPDLECGLTMSLAGRSHAVFLGSGSTSERYRAALVDEHLKVRVVNLGDFFASVAAALDLGSGGMNLEGATLRGDRVVFAQRGNDGVAGVNALVSVQASEFEQLLLDGRAVTRIETRRFELGTLAGARLGFTSLDTLDDGTILFAAAAEASANTYDDGACTGSLLGVTDGDTVLSTARIGDGTDKVEGIAISREFPGGFECVAVVDADDPERPAEALQLLVTR